MQHIEMNDAYRRKLRINLHISLLMMDNVEKEFPLPEAPPDQCRDAFLKEFLAPYELEPDSDSTTSTLESSDSAIVHFAKFVEYYASFNAEENLVNQIKRKTLMPKGSMSTVKSDPPRLMGADLSKLLKERYGSIASAIGFMAALLQLMQLQSRLRIVHKMWSFNISTDRSLRMFSWSIKDYFTRFSLPSSSYLDAVERELGKQMECFKFRMDLKEIERLLEAVCEDFRNKTDICSSSMLLIQDAQMNIEELLTKSRKDANEENQKVIMAAFQAPRSPDPDHSRARAVSAKLNYNDFIYPIEARYRIKWAQTTMEESIYRDTLSVQQMTDKIMSLNNQNEEMARLWDISTVAFDMQIMDFKNRILTQEIAYEANIDHWAILTQTTRNRLNKAKDDLKYYKEQIPMFHKKIEHVKALQYQKEAQEQALAVRKSRLSSRHSVWKKKAPKKKK